MKPSSEPPWLEGIKGQHARSLIGSDAPIIRVVAGPGSGKTTCLKRRTRRLVQGLNVDGDTVFVGTFTRAIAKELKEALSEEINISTLHSLAYGLLRKYPEACQGMSLRFLLEFEQTALLYDIASSLDAPGNVHDRRRELRRLQASRANRVGYDNARFAGAVKRWLQRHGAMLIGEVVYLCVVGLESEDIPRGQFDHVVIDEYQDLTAAEQELTKLVYSDEGSLTVLGDDDQSIYRFRFCHPDGITQFLEQWPDRSCLDLSFAENRRCGDQILAVANLMMAEAGSRKPPMIPKSGRDGQLTAVQWRTLDDEIAGLAEYIQRRNEESFLVLVPRRIIGHRLSDAIGSDARTAFAEEVLEHSTAQEAFAAASMLADSNDRAATRAWLGFRGQEPRQASCRNADAYASLPEELGGHDLLRAIAGGEVQVVGTGRTHIKGRAQRAVRLIDQAMAPEDAVNELFREALAETETDLEKRKRLVQNLWELRTAGRELLEDGVVADLGALMNRLRYRIATRAPLRESADDDVRVKIMTLHSAKGLEADNVVLAGLVDQFMPGEEAEQDVIAEQRRLLYVAVTRARDSLLISWSRQLRYEDLMQNRGRIGRVVTRNGERWVVASRSSLLPQGLTGVVPGAQWLG